MLSATDPSKRIDFHDAVIADVHISASFLLITFSQLPILSDDDDDDDDATAYAKGRMLLEQPSFASLPTPGTVWSAAIHVAEARLELVPFTFEANVPCSLVAAQESGTHTVYAKRIKMHAELDRSGGERRS